MAIVPIKQAPAIRVGITGTLTIAVVPLLAPRHYIIVHDSGFEFHVFEPVLDHITNRYDPA